MGCNGLGKHVPDSQVRETRRHDIAMISVAALLRPDSLCQHVDTNLTSALALRIYLSQDTSDSQIFLFSPLF